MQEKPTYEELEEKIKFLQQENEYLKEELKKSKEKSDKDLKNKESLKSAFLQNISHEIRTPMNGILGFTNMLKNPNINEDKKNAYIQAISDNVIQLLKVLNEIIEISKIEIGEVGLAYSPVNLNDLLFELFFLFERLAKAKNINLNFNNNSRSKRCFIYTDIGKLKDILNNLLKNAIKFTNEGDITFEYEIEGDTIRFSVKDTGIGIDSEIASKIFENFQQAEESITKKYGGVGLGLSISKAYIELMGGKIWFVPNEEKGSTFYFTIPYKPVENLNYKTEEEGGLWNEKTILIAEDEDVNYLFIAVLLEEIQTNIIHAKNGEEAVEIFKNNPSAIDCILMDIRMPVMNGYEATKIIKEIKSDIPIIAQTAFALTEDRKKALEAGCDDYVSKPINKDRLYDILVKYKIIDLSNQK